MYTLDAIKTVGIMGHDRSVMFTEKVTCIAGGIGKGKSEIMESIQLLATGKAARVGSDVDAMMLLARDGMRMHIDGRFRTRNGHVTLRRQWERNPETNVVSADIKGSIIPQGVNSKTARKAFVDLHVGGWAESWVPLDLRTGGAKLRRKLIQLLGGGTGMRPSDFMVPDLPTALRPLDETEETIDAWTEGATKRAKTAAKLAAERLARAEADLKSAIADIGSPPSYTETDIAERHEAIEVERRALEAHARAEKEVARLDRLLADIDRKLAELGAVGTVADAEAAHEELIKLHASQGATVQLREASDAAAARAVEAWRKASAAPKRGWPVYDPQGAPQGPPTAEELAEAQARAERAPKAAEEAAAALRAAYEAATAARAAAAPVTLPAHLHRCPDCRYDLKAHVDREAGDALARGAEAEAAEAGAQAALEAAQAEVGASSKAHLAIVDRAYAWGVLAAAWDAWAEVERITREAPPWPKDRVTDAQLAEAKAAVIRARRAVELRAERDRVDLERDVAESARLALPKVRPAAEVEAEAEALDERLKAIGAWQARGERITEARDARDEAARAKAEADRWVLHMAETEGRVVARVKLDLEAPLGDLMGEPVEVVLIDPRGNPDCRVRKASGADFAVMSVGEQLIANIAILRALGRVCGAEWRCPVLDEFQALRHDMRERVLAALVEGAEAGDFDQAIVGGALDILPNVRGVQVIDLDNDNDPSWSMLNPSGGAS